MFYKYTDRLDLLSKSYKKILTHFKQRDEKYFAFIECNSNNVSLNEKLRVIYLKKKKNFLSVYSNIN